MRDEGCVPPNCSQLQLHVPTVTLAAPLFEKPRERFLLLLFELPADVLSVSRVAAGRLPSERSASFLNVSFVVRGARAAPPRPRARAAAPTTRSGPPAPRTGPPRHRHRRHQHRRRRRGGWAP